MNEDSCDDSLNINDGDFEDERQADWGDFFDFQRCERPNGTFYGIRDGWICRKGRPVGPRPKPPPRPRAPKKPRALKRRVLTKKPLAPQKPRAPQPRSVDRAIRIRVTKTGRKSGKSEEQKKNERLAEMDVRGAFKSSSASSAAQQGGLGSGDKEISEGRRGRKISKFRLSLPKKLVRRKLLLNSLLRKIRAGTNRRRAIAQAKANRLSLLKLERTKRKIDKVKDKKVTKPALERKNERYLKLKREVAARRSRREPIPRNALEGIAQSRPMKAPGERKSKVSAKAAPKPEKTVQAAKTVKSSKPERTQKTSEARPDLAARRNEVKVRITKEFNDAVKKQRSDPNMKAYLDVMSAEDRRKYDEKTKRELRERIKSALKDEGLIPNDEQIREAQLRISRKEFAPQNGKIRFVKLNGRYDSELENEVSSGLDEIRKYSPDANEKINGIMKALERKPIVFSEYDYWQDDEDETYRLASMSHMKGKLVRAGANPREVGRILKVMLDERYETDDWEEENGWAASFENTVFLTGAKKVRDTKLTTKQAASSFRSRQKGGGGTWGLSTGSADATLIHEIGHIMHVRAMTKLGKSGRGEVERFTERAIQQRGVKAPSMYGKTNSFETMAELYTAYVMYGPQLKEEMPESYEFIDQMAKLAYEED